MSCGLVHSGIPPALPTALQATATSPQSPLPTSKVEATPPSPRPSPRRRPTCPPRILIHGGDPLHTAHCPCPQQRQIHRPYGRGHGGSFSPLSRSLVHGGVQSPLSRGPITCQDRDVEAAEPERTATHPSNSKAERTTTRRRGRSHLILTREGFRNVAPGLRLPRAERGHGNAI